DEQAVSYLEQAIGVTRDAHERADLLERAATSGSAAGLHEKAIDFARRAVEAHGEADDRSAAGRATGLLGTVLMDAGDLDEASRVLDEALAGVPDGPAQDEVRAVLLAQRSRALMRLARYPESVDVADRALALAERLNLEQAVA